jgi:hypothetical protein
VARQSPLLCKTLLCLTAAAAAAALSARAAVAAVPTPYGDGIATTVFGDTAVHAPTATIWSLTQPGVRNMTVFPCAQSHAAAFAVVRLSRIASDEGQRLWALGTGYTSLGLGSSGPPSLAGATNRQPEICEQVYAQAIQGVELIPGTPYPAGLSEYTHQFWLLASDDRGASWRIVSAVPYERGADGILGREQIDDDGIGLMTTDTGVLVGRGSTWATYSPATDSWGAFDQTPPAGWTDSDGRPGYAWGTSYTPAGVPDGVHTAMPLAGGGWWWAQSTRRGLRLRSTTGLDRAISLTVRAPVTYVPDYAVTEPDGRFLGRSASCPARRTLPAQPDSVVVGDDAKTIWALTDRTVSAPCPGVHNTMGNRLDYGVRRQLLVSHDQGRTWRNTHVKQAPESLVLSHQNTVIAAFGRRPCANGGHTIRRLNGTRWTTLGCIPVLGDRTEDD